MVQFSTFLERFFPIISHWGRLRALVSAGAFACGISLSAVLSLPFNMIQQQLYPILLVVATTCLVIGVVTVKKRICFVAFFWAGFLLYSLQIARSQEIERDIQQVAMPVRIYGDIISTPAPRRDKFEFLFIIREIAGKRDDPLVGKKYICQSTHKLFAAGSLHFNGNISSGIRRKNRYDFDEKSYLMSSGIVGKITVLKIISAQLPQTLLARISIRFKESVISVLKQYKNPNHRAFIRASFLGEKAYLASEIKEAFRKSGLYHLLALSGLHAGILLAAVYLLLQWIPLRAWIKHCSALAVLWIYYLYIGPVPSLARAVIMATAVILSLLFQRKNYPMQSLGIAALIWLIFSPSSLFQPGFQLSFAATFGILTLCPLFIRLYSGSSHPVFDYCFRLLIITFSVSFAAFCTTLPILLYHFGCVSLFGLVANIVAATLMTGAMWSFFTALLSAVLFPWISQAAVIVSGLLLDCLLKIAYLTDNFSLSSIQSSAFYPELSFVYYMLLFGLVTVSRIKMRMFLKWGVVVTLCIFPGDYLIRRATEHPRVIQFDSDRETVVTAVRWPRGTTWLFCSGKEYSVRYSLRRSVASWVRHCPGTIIKRVCIITPENNFIDSCVTKRSRQIIDNVAAFTMIQAPQKEHACTCLFVPEEQAATLTVSCRGVRLISKHAESVVTLNGGRQSRQKKVAAPVEVAIKNEHFLPRPFN